MGAARQGDSGYVCEAHAPRVRGLRDLPLSSTTNGIRYGMFSVRSQTFF